MPDISYTPFEREHIVEAITPHLLLKLVLLVAKKSTRNCQIERILCGHRAQKGSSFGGLRTEAERQGFRSVESLSDDSLELTVRQNTLVDEREDLK